MTAFSLCLVCGGDSDSNGNSKPIERHYVDALLPVFSEGRSACQRLTGVLSADLDSWSTQSEVVCLTCYHLLARFDFLDLLIQEVCGALIGRFVSACNQSGSDYRTKKAKTAGKCDIENPSGPPVAENLSTVTAVTNTPAFTYVPPQQHKNQHQSRGRQEGSGVRSKELTTTSDVTSDFTSSTYNLSLQQTGHQLGSRHQQQQEKHQRSLTAPGPVQNLSVNTSVMDCSAVYRRSQLVPQVQQHQQSQQRKPNQQQQKQSQFHQQQHHHKGQQRLRLQDNHQQQQQEQELDHQRHPHQQRQQKHGMAGSFSDPAENLSANAPESSIFHYVSHHQQHGDKTERYVLPDISSVENLSTNTAATYLPPVYDSVMQEGNGQSHQSQPNIQQQHRSQQGLRTQLQSQQNTQQMRQSQQSLQAQHQSQQGLQTQHQSQQSLQTQHQSQQGLRIQHQSEQVLPTQHQSRQDSQHMHQSQQNTQQMHQSQHNSQQMHQSQQSLQTQHQTQQNIQQLHQSQPNIQQQIHQSQQSLQIQRQTQHNIKQIHQSRQSLQTHHQSQQNIQQIHQSQHSIQQMHEPQQSTQQLQSIQQQQSKQPVQQTQEENLTLGYPVCDLSTNIASSFLTMTYQPVCNKQQTISVVSTDPVQNLTVSSVPRHKHYPTLTPQEGHYHQQHNTHSQQPISQSQYSHLQPQQHDSQPQQHDPQPRLSHLQSQHQQSSLANTSTDLSTSNTIGAVDFHVEQIAGPPGSVMEQPINQDMPLSVNLIVSSSATDMASSIDYVTSPVLNTGSSSSSALIDCFNASSMSTSFGASAPTNTAMTSGALNNNGGNNNGSVGFCFSSGTDQMLSTPQTSLNTPAGNQAFSLPEYIYLPEAHRPATTSLLSTLPDESFCLDYSTNPPGPINLTSEILSSCQAVSPSTPTDVSPATRTVESPDLTSVNSATLQSLSTSDSALPLNANVDELGLRTGSGESLPISESVIHSSSSVQRLNGSTLNVVSIELDPEEHLVDDDLSCHYRSLDPNQQNCQIIDNTAAQSHSQSVGHQHEQLFQQQRQSDLSHQQQQQLQLQPPQQQQQQLQSQQLRPPQQEQQLQSQQDQSQQQIQATQHQAYPIDNTVEQTTAGSLSLKMTTIRVTAPNTNNTSSSDNSSSSVITTTPVCERGSKCSDICVLDKEWSELKDGQRLRLGKYKGHSTESPIQCFYCEMFTSHRIEELRSHFYQHHSPTLVNDSTLIQGKQSCFRMGVFLKNATDCVDCAAGGRPYVCIFCDGVYKTIQSLRHHFRSAHTPNLRYPCSACGQRFRRQIELTRHRVYHCSFSESARIYRQHREAASANKNGDADSQ